jgi:hypothetical protein
LKGLLKKLRNQLFFREILLINFEAYLELLIAGYINYKFPLKTTNGEVIAAYVSYYALFICLLVMPSVGVWVMIQDT